MSREFWTQQTRAQGENFGIRARDFVELSSRQHRKQSLQKKAASKKTTMSCSLNSQQDVQEIIA